MSVGDLTWTQPICENRWRETHDYDPVRFNAPPQEWERCCYCGTPTDIYVRLDPKTVPFPRTER